MTHGSLFSGIGGFDLAAEWVGWKNIFQVEIDDFCNKVLEKHFPNVQRFRDIKEFRGEQFRGRVDVVSGGFPCQPFSQAGKRKGTADDRYLWPEMLRVISEVKPSFVVGENVAGLVSMENGKTLERILSDLENEGYQTESFIIPACSVGARHQRERIWITAHSNSGGLQRIIQKDVLSKKIYKKSKTSNWINSFDAITWDKSPINSGELRIGDGIPNWVDRLKSLGNAIVPQVAYEIFKAIDSL